MKNKNDILKNINKIFVRQLNNKNQFVIEYNNAQQPLLKVWAFQSYSTLIALYEPNTKKLYINWSYWDYSKTTSKYLKIFINEYTCYSYENKQQFMLFIKNNDNVILFE